ncbi:glycosyl hydrolase family 28 protein [Gorillibacterium massiliense]|uniref:glycosyl hydrolase family 28 protein n=1 Tax=Gorillibacterium massiliense TaxID=1280390 RepID=UPI0004AD53ED|nr:glycosyl hydrolase family 28 protein [Gorillibacterium massiliense]
MTTARFMKIKGFRIAAAALMLLYMLPGCQQPAAKEVPVATYSAPADLPVNYRSTDFTVKAGDSGIDLYNGGNNSWNEPVSYGYFDLPGSSTIAVTPNFDYETFEIVPRSLGIKGERKGNAITFKLDRPANVSLVLDGNYHGKVLHLFAEEPEKDIPDPADPNVIYFGPGYHDHGDYGEPPTMIGSNQTLYISGGAVVRGRFRADHATGVTVRGRGILLNDYRSNDEYDDIALSLNGVTDSTVKDIIVNRDTNSWTSSMYGSSNVQVLNYKAVSPRYASSDGFNINSSHDIVFDGSFIHSADDAVAIKGLSQEEDPAKALPVYNITYKNAQLWSDANNGIGIGAETVAAYFKNITFSNIDILYNFDDRDHPDELPDRSAINIFALHGTEISGITFEDIRVEKAKRLINVQMDTSFYFGALQGNWAWPGSISGITYKNIVSYSDGTNEIKVQGWSKERQISDILFEHIRINGKKVKALNDPHFTINEYAHSLKVKP